MAAEGTQSCQERRRLQSEAPSDMADCGSSIGHLDDLASVGTVSDQQPVRNSVPMSIGSLYTWWH